ncbi:MAG: L,D-transpeptidase family protein [Clostridia bacterium]
MKRVYALLLILVVLMTACIAKFPEKTSEILPSEAEALPSEELAWEEEETESEPEPEITATPLPEDVEELEDDASLEPDKEEEEEAEKKKEEAKKKPLPYKIQVDVTNQVVTILGLDKNGEYTKVVRRMICSTGTSATPTPLGTFTMPGSRGRWGYFKKFDVWAQYWSRIRGGILFHSVIYKEPDESTLSVGSLLKLGQPASHGCIRLQVADAKWIYNNCPGGTQVTVMKGKKNPKLTASLKPKLKPVSIALDVKDSFNLQVGSSKKLVARVTYEYGVVEKNPSDLTWTVSDKKIATVKDGVVEAMAPGTASVKVSIGKLFGPSVKVNVKKAEPELTGLAISPSDASFTLIVGDKKDGQKQLAVKALFDDKSEKFVTKDAAWTSNNEKVATVKGGLVKAVGKGQAEITASYKGQKVTVKVIVKEPDPTPTPKPSPSQKPTPTPSPTQSPTPTPDPSDDPNPSENPEPTESPTATPTATATIEPEDTEGEKE